MLLEGADGVLRLLSRVTVNRDIGIGDIAETRLDLTHHFVATGYGRDRFALYDLEEDIAETTNLAGQKPELVSRYSKYFDMARR